MTRENLIGRPWAEAKALLEQEGVPYQTEITRPTRDFFKTDENCLYVVRAIMREGELLITLVGKQKRKSKEE